jgi:hypothetical protein
VAEIIDFPGGVSLDELSEEKKNAIHVLINVAEWLVLQAERDRFQFSRFNADDRGRLHFALDTLWGGRCRWHDPKCPSTATV